MVRRKSVLRSALAVALGSSLLASACISSEGPLPGVRVRHERAPYARIRMNTVGVLQTLSGDRSALAVEQNDARRTGSGTVEVFATLRNRTHAPLQIEARTHFFDETERPVEAASAWQRLFLLPSALAHYREFSTQVHAAYYYVEVREVH